jgi:hypothetical protein
LNAIIEGKFRNAIPLANKTQSQREYDLNMATRSEKAKKKNHPFTISSEETWNDLEEKKEN